MTKYFALMIVVLLFLVSGCKEEKIKTEAAGKSSEENVQVDQDKSEEAAEEKAYISYYSSIAESAEGAEVIVEGQFWGWSGTKAECVNEIGSPPVSRSDWILKLDDEHCIYVSGPVPVGLDKLEPHGEKTVIEGVVKKLESGQIYLELN
ncbi:hypothetical protein JXI42_05310 [bacterium]|nr:hypothetical protein [bacterium]